MKKVLTIAGSDCSGGAGIQADLKTMLANGVYGMSVITSLTAQNTTGVKAIENVTTNFLKDQIDSVFEDIVPKVEIHFVNQHVSIYDAVCRSHEEISQLLVFAVRQCQHFFVDGLHELPPIIYRTIDFDFVVFACILDWHIFPIPTTLEGAVNRKQTLVAGVHRCPDIEIVWQ